MNRLFAKNGNQGADLRGYLIVVVFCLVYAAAVVILLPDAYSTGTSYEKRFSPFMLAVCAADALLLYALTERTVSRDNSIQNCTIRIVFWVYAVPMSLYPALFNPKYLWPFWISFHAYWVILCFLTPRMRLFRTRISVTGCSRRVKQFIGIFSICLISYLIIIQLRDFHFSLDLGDVYDVRAEFKEQMSQNTLSVFKTIFGSYICPCILVLFLKEKKAFQCLFLVFLQLVLFSMAKDKIMLVYLLAAVIIGVFPEKKYQDTARSLPLAALAVCGLNLLAMCGVLTTLIFTLVTRRMFLMPVWGNYIWFEFFTDHAKLWLHQDIFLIDKLFSPVYESAAPAVIAASIGGRSYSFFNTGMMAVAYSQLGVLGFVLGPVVLGLWLDFLHIFYEDKSLPVKLMLSFSISQAIINSTTIEFGNIVIFLVIAAYAGVFPDEREDDFITWCAAALFSKLPMESDKSGNRRCNLTRGSETQ